MHASTDMQFLMQIAISANFKKRGLSQYLFSPAPCPVPRQVRFFPPGTLFISNSIPNKPCDHNRTQLYPSLRPRRPVPSAMSDTLLAVLGTLLVIVICVIAYMQATRRSQNQRLHEDPGSTATSPTPPSDPVLAAPVHQHVSSPCDHPCESNATKEACVACSHHRGCGWCADTQRCMVGTVNGPGGATGCHHWTHGNTETVRAPSPPIHHHHHDPYVWNPSRTIVVAPPPRRFPRWPPFFGGGGKGKGGKGGKGGGGGGGGSGGGGMGGGSGGGGGMGGG